MSELTQSGQHPDADQLSAFVEHALPPHEHEQTLAHLAICPDCRAIVALSLPPLDESPTTHPEPTRRPWLSGWILAWPTAAALAGLAFFIIHLHNAANSKGSAEPTQIATTHPPPPLPAQNAPPAAVATPPSLPATKPLPRTGASATSTARLTKPLISGTVINGHQPIGAVAIEGRNSSTLPQAQAAGAGGAIGGQLAFHHGGTAGKPMTPTAMTAESPQPNLFTAGNASSTAFSPSPAKTPAATPSNPATASSAPASTTLDAVSVDADTNASATSLTATGAGAPAAAPAFTLKATTNVALPSSLPVLSTATNGNQILAIDTQNSLFYSEDGGKHWSPIAAPWRGHAIRVNLARPANSVAAATSSLTTSSFGATGHPIATAARTTGTALAGTITDATGAVISDASVIVSNTATKTARTVQTDRNGRYLADNLTPGSYQIEATAPGFSKQQLAAVAVTAAQQNQANLTLAVGSTSETVTVEASSSVMPLATSPAPQLAAPRAALKKAAPSSAASQPAPIFEITTDNGDRWTSPDGKTWTQK
jgi:Carboxypeptidase regulatory-like domain/Putative zinc-finger